MNQLSRFATWLGAGEDEGLDDAVGAEDPFLLENADEDTMQQLLQQFAVLLEYERLPDLLPSGMYVMPSFDSVFVWHGTMFVSRGLYRGGVFKFLMQLPEDYPNSPPELRFVSEVFHPLVEPGTGRLDLGAFLPEWRAGRDYASCVLPHLHRAFLRREYFGGAARPPANAEARELYEGDPPAFAERATACVRLSIEKVHENPSPGSSLQFSKGPAEKHDEILAQLRAAGPPSTQEDAKMAFVDWFCEHYAHQRVRVGVETEEVETRFFEKDVHDGASDVSETESVEENDDDDDSEADVEA